MRKVVGLTLAAFLLVLVNAEAFTKPSKEQVGAAAEDPAKIGELVQDASNEQAASVLLDVIRAVQELDLGLEEQREQIAALFAHLQEALGEDDAVLVINDVAKRLDPELLPTVAAPAAATVAAPSLPIALPLAPPIAPRYEGQ